MRQETNNIYKFDELSASSQETAVSNYRNLGREYHWIDDGMDSIKSFCRHYGVSLKNYELSPYSHSFIDTDAENSNFRGITLKQVENEKDLMPTGYCIDSDLYITMFESMKTHQGNALEAFSDAIEAGKKSMLDDMRVQDEDEYISEHLEFNCYEFYEDGSFYKESKA